MRQFNNNNNEFLNKKLGFLKGLLKDFETCSLQLSLSFLDKEHEDFKSLEEGAKIMANIEFIKRCINIAESLIKNNEKD